MVCVCVHAHSHNYTPSFLLSIVDNKALSHSHTNTLTCQVVQKTKQQNKNNSQSMSSKLTAQFHSSLKKKKKKKMPNIKSMFFNEVALQRESLKLFTMFPFLIKPARRNLGWRMCSIQWNGYLGHDE